jgi:hypothetical protein
MEFYNPKIQLDINVIRDIFNENSDSKKILVFGLGYDSLMWSKMNNNVIFVENKREYIELNEKDISSEKIVEYDYTGLTVSGSLDVSDEILFRYPIPSKILENGPYDIILIDGPEGYSLTTPGRRLPCYWARYFLSKPGTLVYIDDARRPLETFCINHYFKDNKKILFNKRLACCKIYM